ncbi:transcriptional regulatory protein DegU [bacterium BMS3Bbin11]|nr:transcriptional regulatory protein DegU [bacterium BMS3Abin11]GBE46662.1 transcriptional regulatory protein DegU [bacterium BMS3Bbin11]HDH17181.1 response regulator [Gammaproteobacteria bacterium]HDZ79285.1 response regulator [Gammaproteobacteria bacterium]
MRILLIDDHTLFRVGLQGLLENRNIEVVASIGDGNEGIRVAMEILPDIILLDMRMPEPDGLAVLHKLRENGLEMPIVILTTSSDENDLVASLRNGASGYLLKDMEPDALVQSLREVQSGKTVVAPELAGSLARVVQGAEPENIQDPEHDPFSELTPRETEILTFLANGQSNKSIARDLGISDGTVKLHVKAILRKLGVHSRVEAAVIAVEQGLRESYKQRNS